MQLMKWLPRAAIGLACCAFAACVSVSNAQDPQNAPAMQSPTQPSPVSAPAVGGPSAAIATSGPSEYRLASGDQLKLTVYGEQELSGTFQIDGQGAVSMPLIGETNAGGLTLREFQRAVETKLAEYLRQPRVAVEVVNYRPFYIFGEVNKAGNYPYVNGLTVMNAIATAGDFTYRADRRRIFIKRVGEATEHEVELTPNLTLQPGDTIRVKQRLF